VIGTIGAIEEVRESQSIDGRSCARLRKNVAKQKRKKNENVQKCPISGEIAS
jgi:hypothetical protein